METIKNNRRILQTGLLLIGLLILAYVIYRSDIIENYRMLLSVNIPLLLLAFGVSIGTLALRVYRWKFLSEKYNTAISWHDSSIVSIASLFYANITPGKIGDLYKAYYMQRRYAMRFFTGVSMIFYERFFELMILFLAALRDGVYRSQGNYCYRTRSNGGDFSSSSFSSTTRQISSSRS